MDMATIESLRPDVDSDWTDIASNWTLRQDVHYLNHGSFGLAPDVVRNARRGWIDQLDSNPMDFFVRRFEPLIDDTKEKLARFLKTESANLAFVDNATYAMNVVANSFPLEADDEVLLTDHEYGAVERCWYRKCDNEGARVVKAHLPETIESADQVVDAVFDSVTDKTRLIVISHITSATAITLPVQKVCDRARGAGIAVCIDGPHALVQEDVHLDELGCDFYAASCHKWLCATLGSGFVYSAPRWHGIMQPLNKSWGRLLPAVPETWSDEFDWSGTRDPSAILSVGTAIDFIEAIGISNFRRRSQWLSANVRNSLETEFGTKALTPDEPQWYCSMAHVPLPKKGVGYGGLQDRLWREFQIEIPVIEFGGQWFIRVSSHLYNSAQQADFLMDCLRRCLV